MVIFLAAGKLHRVVVSKIAPPPELYLVTVIPPSTTYRIGAPREVSETLMDAFVREENPRERIDDVEWVTAVAERIRKVAFLDKSPNAVLEEGKVVVM